MASFGNQAVNRLNLHSAIQGFATNAGGVFIFVYLLKAGVPMPLVFCAIAGMSACRFALRPLVLPLARTIGLRRLVILGTVLESVVYPMLPTVHGPGIALVSVIGAGAVGSVLYWTSYHAYFASIGDAEHRGGQVGARESIMALVCIVAPICGAWAIEAAGPPVAFLGVAAIQLLAAAPLIGAPDAVVALEPADGRRAYLHGAIIQATDGWVQAGYYYIWQIALFVSLKERFAAYGGAMALAAILGAIGALVVGRLIDRGHARRFVVVSYGLGVAVAALKGFGYRDPSLAVAANALGAFAASFLSLTMMSRVYNLSQASPCPLRFHIATEGGWDTGCALGCLAAAGLSAVGAGLTVSILMSALGLIAGAAMLIASYGPAGRANERNRGFSSKDEI